MAFFPEESGSSLVVQCFADCTLTFLLTLTDEGQALKGLGQHCLATVTLTCNSKAFVTADVCKLVHFHSTEYTTCPLPVQEG